MTEDDKRVLEEQHSDTLAEWWCILNRWGWPDGLPNPMTREERNPTPYVGGGRASQIMDWIDGRIGHKKVSRVWNKDMTDDQHDLFWRGSFEGDEEAKKKHDAWTLEIIEAEINTEKAKKASR